MIIKSQNNQNYIVLSRTITSFLLTFNTPFTVKSFQQNSPINILLFYPIWIKYIS